MQGKPGVMVPTWNLRPCIILGLCRKIKYFWPYCFYNKFPTLIKKKDPAEITQPPCCTYLQPSSCKEGLMRIDVISVYQHWKNLAGMEWSILDWKYITFKCSSIQKPFWNPNPASSVRAMVLATTLSDLTKHDLFVASISFTVKKRLTPHWSFII